MISVFYDGKCGQCSREIAYFRKKTPRCPILWQDIATEPQLLNGTGLTQAEALLFMRVRDEEGRIKTGVDAFIILWSLFPGWALLARFLALPGIHALAGAGYGVFARYRFNKHPHCQASLTSG